MKKNKFLWILIYICAILLPSFFYVYEYQDSSLLMILSGFCGITSYSLFAFQFLLVSRPKFIDQHFGLDRIYRFHMLIAIPAILLAFAHKLLKELYFPDSFQTELGDLAFVLFIIIGIFSILMMINKLLIKVNIVDTFRKLLNKYIPIKHQHKVLIHNLTLLAMMILFIHILLAGSFESVLPLKIILTAYFAIPMAFYLNHKIIKRFFNKQKKYTISDIVHESSSIVTLRLKPRRGKIFPYIPGQFLYIRIAHAGIPHDEHPFSISSDPSQKDYVSITVKQLGDFTNLLTNTTIGDNAYIDGAFGSFSYLKNASEKKICFIAGGIGITPFLSMIRHMKSCDYENPVTLLWGVRDLSEVICKDELKSYSDTLSNLCFVPVLSNDPTYQGEKGFITADLIKKYTGDILAYDFYICGPPIMLEMQLNILKQLGVPKGNIHFERFAI